LPNVAHQERLRLCTDLATAFPYGT